MRCGQSVALNRDTSLRLVLGIVVTLMSTEICEHAAGSNLWPGDGEDRSEED